MYHLTMGCLMLHAACIQRNDQFRRHICPCSPVSYTHLDVYKRQLPYLGDLDLRMEGRQRDLLVVQYLLVQLLAGTKTRKPDLYVLGARKLNHTFRQVDDTHGLAHVEDEDLPTVTPVSYTHLRLYGACTPTWLPGQRLSPAHLPPAVARSLPKPGPRAYHRSPA